MKLTNRETAWICRINIGGVYFDSIPGTESQVDEVWAAACLVMDWEEDDTLLCGIINLVDEPSQQTIVHKD